MFSCPDGFSVFIGAPNPDLSDACCHRRRPSIQFFQFYRFLQFPRFFQFYSLSICFCCSTPPLSPKIPSSKTDRRSRNFLYCTRRCSFADEELAEILTYEESVRLRVRANMTTRIVPVVSRPLPTFSGSMKEDVLEFIEAINCAHQRKRALYDEETAPAQEVPVGRGVQRKGGYFHQGFGAGEEGYVGTLGGRADREVPY
jgi:hypothetical protein